MEKNTAVEFLLNPTVFIAVFIGASALLLVYILKLFKIEHDAEEKNQSEISSTHSERKKESSSGKSKKKPPAERWSGRGDKGFSSPWLLKTLKSHTGQVLSIDYSSSGKYLASCGEEEPDPDLDMNTSSGSECNKENSRPPSADPSPRTKGLSRRQRKNRRREDASPDSKKKPKGADAPKRIELSVSERVFGDLLHPHLLTYDQLFAMGYPVQSPAHNNAVVFFSFTAFAKHPRFDVNAREFVPNYSYEVSGSSSDSSEADSEEGSGSEPDLAYYDTKSALRDQGVERTCARCGRGFFVTNTEYLTQERCNYHWGKPQTVHKGDRKHGIESLVQYSCCQGKPGSVGCTTCKLHVWSGVVSGLNGPCEGFVKTRQKKSIPPDGNYGVYALDCEMCYTVAGLEVTKVTVVGMDGKLVYDSYVKPKNEIIDYNTRFSGITAKDLKPGATKALKEVQNDLRGFINASTILIGHGLENDLRALKLIHKNVVDTAWSFPHYNGLPYKRSLKSLVSAYLKREVQCGSNGHNSYEDACACMELMLYKVRKENRDRAVLLWDSKDLTQKDLKSLRVNIEFDHPTFVKWSPDSKAFIIHKYNENVVEVYKIEKKKEGWLGHASKALTFPKAHETDVIGMGIASNGKFIMTCSNKTDLVVWDLKGQKLGQTDTYLMTTTCAKISPCGKFIVASGFAPDAKVWEVLFSKSGEFQEIKRVFELTGHSSGVYDVAFDADSSHMATVSKDGTWKLFDTRIEYKKGENPHLKITGKYQQAGNHALIALSPNAEVVVIATGNALAFYSTSTGHHDCTIDNIYSGRITSILFDAMGKYVLTSGDKFIRVFHNVTGYRCNIQTAKEKLKQNQTSATKERLEKLIEDSEAFLSSIENK